MALSTTPETAAVFDGIAALAQAVTSVVLALGVWVAYSQLSSWRSERLGIRRAEIAEEAIHRAFRVQDAFHDIRNPFGKAPKDKADDRLYGYQQRYEKIAKYNDEFRRLRESQNLCGAFFDDAELDAAFEKLFSARNRVAVALELIAEMIDEPPRNKEERDQVIGWRRDIYSSSKENEVSSMIDEALDIIKRKLTPVIKMTGPNK